MTTLLLAYDLVDPISGDDAQAIEHRRTQTEQEVRKALTPLYPVAKRANLRVAAWGPKLLGRKASGLFGTVRIGIAITDPSHTFDFVLETTLGSLLVLGDIGSMETQETVKYDKSGNVIAYGPGGSDAGDSAYDDFITDLGTLGYDVTSELANGSDPGG